MSKGLEQAKGVRFVPHTDLHKYVTAVFAGWGLRQEDARICADALVGADLRGMWSHGVARVPMYCGRLETGAAKAKPDIKVERVAPAAVLVNGGDGLGLVIAKRAMQEAVKLAKEQGIGMAGVQHSGHFGMGAIYVSQAADAGCIGFAFSNASKALPPHGGRRAFFGTSPIAFAAPTPKGLNFVVDMALSVIARGKVRYAAQRGDRIPEGCALDAQGRPTTDAAAAMEGVVLPMAGHKGSALSWMNDVLGGVFTGAAFGGETGNPTEGLDRPQLTGHVFIAIKADLFMPMDQFNARMGELDARVKAEPPAEGFKEILAPGDPEARKKADYETSGIPLTPDVLKNMREWGDKVGVPWPFG